MAGQSSGRRAIKFVLAMAFSLYAVQAQMPLTRSQKVHDPNVPESLTLTVTPSGLNKSSILLDNGIYEIAVINRTGGRTLSFQLDRLNGASSKSKLVSGGTTRSRDRFQTAQKLTPGTYTLTVINVPTWVCTLTVK